MRGYRACDAAGNVAPPAVLLSPFQAEFLGELGESALLNAGNVAAGDAQLARDFLLSTFRAVSEAEAQGDDLFLPPGKVLQLVPQPVLLENGLHMGLDGFRRRSQDIAEGDLVAFLVNPDRVLEGDLGPRLFQGTQVHQDLVLADAR